VSQVPEVTDEAPLLMAVDGNSLVHRSHHAHAESAHRDLDGRPVWALRGLLVALGAAAERLAPDAVLVAFDDADGLDRAARYPAYKAQRAAKPAELVDQLASAPDLLRAAGFTVVQQQGQEADDVVASAAARCHAEGWLCTVVTSDRDAFALIDDTTAVLRVINGGVGAWPLLTAARLPLLCDVRAGQYGDLAALRGDTSDNLPGARGIGAKTAARLLGAFESVAAAYAALDEGRVADVEAAVGATAARRLATPEARAAVARNLDLMRMRTDLEVPHPDTVRLPLDPHRLHNALRARELLLGRSLWALTEGTGHADPAAPVVVPDVRPDLMPIVRTRKGRTVDTDQLSLF